MNYADVSTVRPLNSRTNTTLQLGDDHIQYTEVKHQACDHHNHNADYEAESQISKSYLMVAIIAN